MPRKWLLAVAAAGAAAVLAVPAPAQEKKGADGARDKQAELRKRTEEAVERGLEWLKKTQAPDGHWDAPGGNYPTSMTALAGMAFLMEGSTLKEGKYSDQVKKAVEWFLAPNRQQANGLLGDVRNQTEATRYMYGQGFGTMFLASVYGEEEDKDQREKLEKCLKRAVEFICKAQTNKRHRKPEGKEVDIGGWGYVSANDGSNFDEGSVTITALQGLRAARNAGIPVPKENVQKAIDYLEACTTRDGGIIYSYAGSGGAGQGGPGHPPLTAAALACGISSGEFARAIKVMNADNPPKGIDRPNVVRWFENAKKNISVGRGRVGHDEYMMYYYAQAMYALGDDRYAKLFPGEKDEASWLTWTKYKEAAFPGILDGQDKTSGAWNGGGGYGIGPVFVTATNLCTLQLEKGLLPVYQR